MEEKEIMDEAFERERTKVMAEANEYFECSGTQTHEFGCDGNCEVKILEPIEVEINNELKRWEALGMVPLGGLYQVPQVPGVPVDSLKTSIALAALTEMCYELGIDKDKLNNKYREMYLERLTSIRRANEDRMKQAQSGIAVAQPPQIVVPDHIKAKMR